MPIRNTIKSYDAPAYYHVYNRGVSDQPIFYDDQDRHKFLSLFARYLDVADNTKRTDGLSYEKYDVKLVAYCLMSNHFHLLLFQEEDPLAMTRFMRSMVTSYSMYFNRKYKHHGHLFQSAYKASYVTNDAYLLHITRYIHMNPRSYLRYPWSSIQYYLGKISPSPRWLHTKLAADISPKDYRIFLEEYEGRKAELKLLKDQLAD